MNNLKANRCP